MWLLPEAGGLRPHVLSRCNVLWGWNMTRQCHSPQCTMLWGWNIQEARCVTCHGDPRCLPPGGFQSISPHVSQGAAQQFCPRICMPASPQGYAGMADRGFSQCQYMRNIPLATAKCTASHTESVAAGLFTHLVLFSPFLAHKMLLFERHTEIHKICKKCLFQCTASTTNTNRSILIQLSFKSGFFFISGSCKI